MAGLQRQCGCRLHGHERRSRAQTHGSLRQAADRPLLYSGAGRGALHPTLIQARHGLRHTGYRAAVRAVRVEGGPDRDAQVTEQGRSGGACYWQAFAAWDFATARSHGWFQAPPRDNWRSPSTGWDRAIGFLSRRLRGRLPGRGQHLERRLGHARGARSYRWGSLDRTERTPCSTIDLHRRSALRCPSPSSKTRRGGGDPLWLTYHPGDCVTRPLAPQPSLACKHVRQVLVV